VSFRRDRNDEGALASLDFEPGGNLAASSRSSVQSAARIFRMSD